MYRTLTTFTRATTEIVVARVRLIPPSTVLPRCRLTHNLAKRGRYGSATEQMHFPPVLHLPNKLLDAGFGLVKNKDTDTNSSKDVALTHKLTTMAHIIA